MTATEGIEIRRNIICQLFVCFLVATLFFPQIAFASSLSEKREEAKRVKNQVDALGRELYKTTAQYNSAVSRLEMIRADLIKTEQELAAAQAELEKDQKILDDRIRDIYRCGNIQFVEVIMGSKNLYEFLVRAEMVAKIGKKDSELLNEVKVKKRLVEEKKAQLAAQKEEQQSVVATLHRQQSEMEANLQKQKSLLAGVEGEVAKLAEQERAARIQAEQARQKKLMASRSSSTSARSRTYSSGPSSIKGFVFPVAGPHSFSNDWGAPRVGHRHQGCDIMAAKGTAAVACVSGVVRTSEGGRQGHAIWLHGDDGTSYFYAHLSGYAVGSGTRVSAGQVIGYVGNTGNASGGAAHLHFEVHPGGGGAVNPYPILRAAN